MKTAVAYFSRTGHSKKIAEAIAASLQLKAFDVKAKPTLEAVDLLVLVGGIYAGASSPELKAYAESISKQQVRKVLLITSCTSNRQKQEMIRQILVKNGIEVVSNEFICQGNFLFFGIGHPNSEEIKAAVSFVKKYVTG